MLQEWQQTWGQLLELLELEEPAVDAGGQLQRAGVVGPGPGAGPLCCPVERLLELQLLHWEEERLLLPLPEDPWQQWRSWSA